jgi:hypothetical protein
MWVTWTSQPANSLSFSIAICAAGFIVAHMNSLSSNVNAVLLMKLPGEYPRWYRRGQWAQLNHYFFARFPLGRDDRIANHGDNSARPEPCNL